MIASAVIVITNHKCISEMEVKTEKIASHIQQIMPQRQPAVLDQYIEADMPVYEIDGTDYCALLCIEKLGVMLPVAKNWNDEENVLARYMGSSYNGTLILGEKGSAWNLDSVTQLDIGDKITVVDMLGGEFNYTVERIDRAKSVMDDNLNSTEHQFTIFSYVEKEKKYVVVRCN